MATKILIMLRPKDGESDEHTPIVDDSPGVRQEAQAHLEAGHTVCVIARWGETEEEQYWGDMTKLESEWHGCWYSIWAGGGYDHPVKDLAEAVAYMTDIATDTGDSDEANDPPPAQGR